MKSSTWIYLKKSEYWGWTIAKTKCLHVYAWFVAWIFHNKCVFKNGLGFEYSKKAKTFLYRLFISPFLRFRFLHVFFHCLTFIWGIQTLSIDCLRWFGVCARNIIRYWQYSQNFQEYSVQLTFREQWLDERLKFNDFGGRLKYLTLTEASRVWMPDLFFSNEKEGHFHNIIMPNVYIRIFPYGSVLYSIRSVNVNKILMCILRCYRSVVLHITTLLFTTKHK